MNISITGGTRGDERHVSISIKGVDSEFIDLIDCLEMSDGSARTLGARLAEHTGLVASPCVDMAEIANALERYASQLRGVAEQRH